MIKVSLTKELREELGRIHNEIGSLDIYVKNIYSLQRDLYKMSKEIKNNQEQLLKSQNIIQEDNNETTFKLLKLNENTTNGYLRQLAKLKLNVVYGKFDTKSDFSKMLETFPYNHWLNDFEVAMVEKALNIQLYPWQKEFLKGSNCVNLNKGSGKTYLFTLAYTLKLITLPMFINYDTDVHRCVLTPVYSNTEKYVGEMFIDFWEKLSVYPFELNTKLELTKDWWGIKWDK